MKAYSKRLLLCFYMSYNKVALATATISTNLFFAIGITPNCANAISNMDKGCQEIPLKGKKLCDSRKLRKEVAIYKTNKLVLSKKYMSLKTSTVKKVSKYGVFSFPYFPVSGLNTEIYGVNPYSKKGTLLKKLLFQNYFR